MSQISLSQLSLIVAVEVEDAGTVVNLKLNHLLPRAVMFHAFWSQCVDQAFKETLQLGDSYLYYLGSKGT